MTCISLPNIARGRAKTGKVGDNQFAVPEGPLPYRQKRCVAHGAQALVGNTSFGPYRLRFDDSNSDGFALVKAQNDPHSQHAGPRLTDKQDSTLRRAVSRPASHLANHWARPFQQLEHSGRDADRVYRTVPPICPATSIHTVNASLSAGLEGAARPNLCGPQRSNLSASLIPGSDRLFKDQRASVASVIDPADLCR